MANQDLYEVLFEWPHPEPTFVIVTGTFDEWSRSIHLTKTPTGFVGSTKIPWGEKIKFKYIVDNQWVLHEDQITETDPGGFVNHTFTAPPAPHINVETSDITSNGHTALLNGLPVEETLKESEIPVVAENGDQSIPLANPAGTEQALDTPPVGLPQILSNIAETIVARDGTSSALEYVTSGLGGAIHTVVGVDPINTPQIAIPTPAADTSFALPNEEPNADNAVLHDSKDHNVAESEPSPHTMAPTIALLIVPVNAAENNSSSGYPGHANEDQVLEPSLTSLTQGGDKEDEAPQAAEPADRSSRETVSNTVNANVEPVPTLHGEGSIMEQAADKSESDTHACENPLIQEGSAPESERIEGTEADVTLPLIEDKPAPSQILVATGNSTEVHLDTQAAEMQARENTGSADHIVPESSEEATLPNHADKLADATTLEAAAQIIEATPDSAEATTTETNGSTGTDLITPSIPISLPDAVAGKDRIQTDFIAKSEVPTAETHDHTSNPDLSVQHTPSDVLQVNESVEVISPPLTSIVETQVDPVRANADTAVGAPIDTSISSPLSPPVTEPVLNPPAESQVSISGPVAKTTVPQAFPLSSESPTASSHNSPSPSRANTMRKKRTSIFGKIKHIFHLDEKDKAKK